MSKFIYSFILLFAISIISGCSDSYDNALADTDGKTADEIKTIITDIDTVLDEKNVTLSEDTQEKITDLENTISQIKDDAESQNNNTSTDFVTTEVINDTFEIIEKVKEDISSDSKLSDDEKESAINKIEVIERDKLQEGLEAYTKTLDEKTDVIEDCNKEVDNSGALPPSFPSDNCIN